MTQEEFFSCSPFSSLECGRAAAPGNRELPDAVPVLAVVLARMGRRCAGLRFGQWAILDCFDSFGSEGAAPLIAATPCPRTPVYV